MSYNSSQCEIPKKGTNETSSTKQKQVTDVENKHGTKGVRQGKDKLGDWD